MRPDLTRVPAYYHNYIQQVKGDDLGEAFRQHLVDFSAYLETLTPEKWDYRYAEGKWTVKELVLHVTDAERVFSYRALTMARMDKTPLPGFDENEYVRASNAGERSTGSLMAELRAVQQSTALLFDSFNEEQLEASGIANGHSVYVRGIGFIIIGHAQHHLRILKERYV